MPSIKKNFIYNVAITLANYIAGLIVFPYVSRCLGVELLGKTSFASNVVAYFSLFALMGAVTVGTREIARCQNNVNKRSQVYSSVLSIVMIMTFICMIIMTFTVFVVPKFDDYKDLLLIGSLGLFFTSCQIEWLYQGIEKFDYIAKRSVLIRIIYCVAIFVFVNNPNDYMIYYVLTIVQTMANGIINLAYSRHFVTFSFQNIKIKQYIKPILSYGVNKILISMYTTFNVLFLGFVCTDTEVGYYSTAIKLFGILLGVISAFTNVILPRMSSLLSNNNIEEFNRKINQSFDVILTVALPISIGGCVMAPQIINILAGPGYDGAILPMQIVMPIIPLTGVAQICIMQVLIPLKKDNAVLIASVIGAFIGVSANILFVNELGAIGSAIVLLLSELISDLFCFAYASKKKILQFPWKLLKQQLLMAIPYIVICVLSAIIPFKYSITPLLFAMCACGLYLVIINAVYRRETTVGSIIRQTLRID